MRGEGDRGRKMETEGKEGGQEREGGKRKARREEDNAGEVEAE